MVVPPSIREELRAHAAEEAPNECCGVIVLRDGLARDELRAWRITREDAEEIALTEQPA